MVLVGWAASAQNASGVLLQPISFVDIFYRKESHGEFNCFVSENNIDFWPVFAKFSGSVGIVLEILATN